ncbi:MAG TPA: hypothetical protein VNE63_01400 [Candidatus Acidoferrales bacterium]|nr:hypothetical protein [Candidatus Acidoferrales bacterium]
MSKYTVALLAFVLSTALGLTACQDTRARQENEQLKSQVLDLQKQLGEMGNRLDEMTKARDDLIKQDAALREERNHPKSRHATTRRAKSKRHQGTHRSAR